MGETAIEQNGEHRGRGSLGMGIIKNTVIASFYSSFANLNTFVDSLQTFIRWEVLRLWTKMGKMMISTSCKDYHLL